MTIGEKIKELRTIKKLSQVKLAELVDVKPNTVCDWEHNRYFPDVQTIRKICDALDTTPNYLIIDTHTTNDETFDKKTLARLLAYYTKLNDKDKETVNQLVESLSKK